MLLTYKYIFIMVQLRAVRCIGAYIGLKILDAKSEVGAKAALGK